MKKLFRVGYLWSGDSEIGVLEDAFLLIENDIILALGPWKSRPRSLKDRKFLDFRSHAVMPGMINLHSHLAMSLFRGFGENVELQTWLNDFIFPAEKKWVGPQMVRAGTELSLCESIRSGVSFVTDMYYHPEVSSKLIEDFGLRGIVGVSFFDGGGFDTQSLEESFVKARRLHRSLQKNSKVQMTLAPHAPYTCSVATLKATAALAQELQCGVMIHTAETKKELVDIKRQTGLSPVALLDQVGLLRSRFALLAHSIWLEDSDYRLLARPQVSCVLNTKCNAKISSGFPHVATLKATHVRWVLGTDGPSTNNTLDLFSEMSFLMKTQRLQSGVLTELSPRDLLESCTIRAAEAIQMQDQIGSLRPGKQADLVFLNLAAPHHRPLIDLEASLVFSARASDVTDVYVAGRCLLERQKLKGIAEPRILKTAQDFAEKMMRDLQRKKSLSSR